MLVKINATRILGAYARQIAIDADYVSEILPTDQEGLHMLFMASGNHYFVNDRDLKKVLTAKEKKAIKEVETRKIR